MIESGPAVGYVYRSDDGNGGYLKGGLMEARAHLNNDIPEAEEMDEVLAAIIEAPTGTSRQVVQELHQDGRYLLGASWSHSAIRAPEALMYTEGHKEGPAFSVVRMGLWAVSVGTQAFDRTLRSEEQRVQLKSALVEHGLLEVDRLDDGLHHKIGVPVKRLTEVRPLHPQDGDVREPFRVGHRKDLTAIEALDIPQSLKEQLKNTARKHHRQEISVEPATQTLWPSR